MTPSRLLPSVVVLALGCAVATTEVSDPAPLGPGPAPSPIVAVSSPAPAAAIVPPAPVAPPPPPPATCTMFAKPGVVQRAALVRVIDAGMPRWLQGVEGDRVLAKHRFQGWVIKSLHPADPCYQEIDLRPGDVVRKVNGKPIEKPDQAFEVFESARTAPAIVVEYLRAGKTRQFKLAISDER
jgi:S1-C subfamily serine protease